MSPSRYSAFKGEFNDECPVVGLDPSSITCYPYPHLPILESSGSNYFFPFSDETCRDNKRLKINTNISIPIYFGSYSPTNCYGYLRNGSGTTIRDHIKRYLSSKAVDQAAEDMINSECGGGVSDEEDGCADGVRLVQLLIACAEAVACRDKSHSSALLSELKSNALVFGSAFQRVTSCFVQGLADRLALIQPAIGPVIGVTQPMMNIMDSASEKMEEAYKLVYEICPHIKFGHYVANMAILEAFEGKSFVHVVDLGMSLGLPHGHQWKGLIQSLASRPGSPVFRLRITGVGLCIGRFQAIGDELSIYANNLGINLEFCIVQKNLENLENLKSNDIKVHEEEVLVVNSILQLHCVVKESRGALNSVLQMIHGLSPKALVMVEQDSSHNGPFFLGRFMESLHYYSAIFDSLDAMLPKYDTKKAKIEQFYFAEEIKNIVSCEGPLRMERHERVDQWRRRMSRVGFQAAPIKMVTQAKEWLVKNKVCDGYTVVEEKGCLVLGWKSKPIVAASCWKC